jgi:predicted PP-loop superfamily ATPase
LKKEVRRSCELTVRFHQVTEKETRSFEKTELKGRARICGLRATRCTKTRMQAYFKIIYPAVEEYFKEIGFAFWNNVEILQVKNVEDVLRRIESAT